MTLILRIVIAFAVIAAIAGIAALLAQSPGQITLHWFGYRIDTSVAVLIALVLLLVGIAAGLYRLWGYLRRIPKSARARHIERRKEEGYLAISRGMLALAVGDSAEAKRQAKKANDILHRPVGALLIGAQAAQLEGKRGKAQQFFEAMLENDETELLGVRGLLAIAEDQGDESAALRLSERAKALAPKTPWALEKLLTHRIGAGQWAEAETALVEAAKRNVIDDAKAKRDRSAILVQLSVMAARLGETKQALERAKRAHDLTPASVPAALQYATLLIDDNRHRQAARLIEKGWAPQDGHTGPHPDLGRLYGRAAKAKDAVRELKAYETLEKLAPEDAVTQLLMARAALKAQLWGETRRHLKRALELLQNNEPTAAYCRLMAELEYGESKDAQASRDWLARATRAAPDEAWVCGECGHADADWSAKCPNCGAFNSFTWKRPSWVGVLDGGGAEAGAPEVVTPTGEQLPVPAQSRAIREAG